MWVAVLPLGRSLAGQSRRALGLSAFAVLLFAVSWDDFGKPG